MIVFLDFDGVAHPDRFRTEAKFCRLPLLESWLRARLAVDVVVSSSWREVHPFKELVEFFSDDIQPRVIGCTPAFHRVFPADLDGGQTGWPLRHKREAEVRQWMLDSWEPHRPWMASSSCVPRERPRFRTSSSSRSERRARLAAIASGGIRRMSSSSASPWTVSSV